MAKWGVKNRLDDVVLVPISPSTQRRRRLLAGLAVSILCLACLVGGGALVWWYGVPGLSVIAGDSSEGEEDGPARRSLHQVKQELDQARKDLAVYRTEAQVGEQAREQLRQEIRALRDQQAELEQAVSFYKSVMSPSDEDHGLVVQKLELSPAEGERRVRYRLVLVQTGENRDALSGRVSFTLRGSRDGEAFTADAADYLEEHSEDKFQFRYFQELSGIVTVPAELQVSSLEVTATASGRRTAQSEQRLPW
ncbi:MULTISPECIES: DUF6776 family protein [Alloalcanivorax]|uniref:HlyD family secretion protein n=2 Tax=Alloalcanivorax TaxID=3020832 RepID=A0A9Q3W9N3_9GAMM|nr:MULTISPECIES: DUF6776 family protein [Alloalcanivorax]ARB48064.1 hypothetical protein P40_18430 [Alloalcanivorax xenomutans]MCE7510773.1 HlyD family secretion protein [Alloalcanivorax xenomutans]